MDKKKITLKRKKGTKLGLVAGPKKADGEPVFIKGIKEGAVADHNALVAPEDRIYPRDSITSIDGSGKNLRKNLAATNTEKVVIELRRSKLPSYLMWLHEGSQPDKLERILTSPGTQSFLGVFSKLGGVGFGLWFLSGYPLASLPLYYFGLSSVMAWHMTKCCHNKDVPAGVPHCYKGGSAKFSVAMTRFQTRGQEVLAKARKNPRAYLKAWFWSPDFVKWL